MNAYTGMEKLLQAAHECDTRKVLVDGGFSNDDASVILYALQVVSHLKFVIAIKLPNGECLTYKPVSMCVKEGE